jgi:hypothetical protein
MTDTDNQAPKKSARPNLFAAPEPTRMADTHISVLASLDAAPLPKRKKKRGGLARGTLVMILAAVILVGGGIYFLLTQEPAAVTADEPHSAAPLAQTAPQTTAAPSTTNNTSAVPSLSLSALAASSNPVAEPSAPASATIENEPSQNPHNPIAILEGTDKTSAASNDTKAIPGTNEHGTPSSLLKALNAPAPDKAQQARSSTRPVAQASPPATHKADTHSASGTAAPHTTHLPGAQGSSVDTDVVLIEALVASSDRQKAKDAAEAKAKRKKQEQAKADKPKVNEQEAAAALATAPSVPPENIKQ